MTDTTCTTDLADFGKIEIAEAAKLLQAYSDGEGEFLGDGVTVMFNRNSGNVFLTDSDYRVGMMNGNRLEEWFTCPECGHEGFLEDMFHESEYDGCFEYMQEIGVFDAIIEPGATSSDSMKLDDIVDGVRGFVKPSLLAEFDNEDDGEERSYIFDEIVDYLNDIAPEGMSFGSQEGDGACFGFWTDEDEAEESA